MKRDTCPCCCPDVKRALFDATADQDGSPVWECRNCHSLESMSSDMQKQRARKQHEMAREDNLTCIACHKGIAHHLPEGMTEEDED